MRGDNPIRTTLLRRAVPLTVAALLALVIGLSGSETPEAVGEGASLPSSALAAADVDANAEAAHGTTPGTAVRLQDPWWSWALERILTGDRQASPSELRGILDRESERARRGPPGRERGRQARGEAPGPAFCRSGEGHPVFGRRWCLEKGFRLGDDVWRRGDVGDVLLEGTGERERAGDPDLVEILGDVILGRLREASGLDGRRDLTGRWVRSSSGEARVLQLRSGARPVAELTDLEGDGRVDVVLIAEPDGEG